MFNAHLKTTPLQVKEVTTTDLQKLICYAYNLDTFQIWSEADYCYKKLVIEGMGTLEDYERENVNRAIRDKEVSSLHVLDVMQDLRNRQFLQDGVYLLDITW